jgi:hypothetical protein
VWGTKQLQSHSNETQNNRSNNHNETMMDLTTTEIPISSRNSIQEGTASASTLSSSPPTPLAFQFRGYSIWLELEKLPGEGEEQTVDNNHNYSNHTILDAVVSFAAAARHVQRIPGPHVTVLYGIEEEHEKVLEQFRMLRDSHLTFGKEPLVPISYKMDVSYDGVDGQDMDMTWMEITYANHEGHQANVNLVRDIMTPVKTVSSTTTTVADDNAVLPPPWSPHLSIFYENPSPILDTTFADAIIAKFPTLLLPRRPIAMSLWSTKGTMSEWKLIDRFPLVIVPSENAVVGLPLDLPTNITPVIPLLVPPTIIANMMVTAASDLLEEDSILHTDIIQVQAS